MEIASFLLIPIENNERSLKNEELLAATLIEKLMVA
jgi:hypothetical protein